MLYSGDDDDVDDDDVAARTTDAARERADVAREACDDDDDDARARLGESVSWADDDIATLARGGTRGVALMRLVIASADWREQPTATTLAKRRARRLRRLLTPHRTTRPTRWVKR